LIKGLNFQIAAQVQLSAIIGDLFQSIILIAGLDNVIDLNEVDELVGVSAAQAGRSLPGYSELHGHLPPRGRWSL
jgi:hypothetical protein